jgi:CubicO group peptidase (beta-lactamase class C family)
VRSRSVTLANWLEAPGNRWGFCHVRELVPTARIGRGDGPTTRLDLGEQLDLREAMDASYTDALLVIHRGLIVAEYYGPEMTRDTTHLLMSVSKSVTSSLTGVLVEGGVLSIDDRVDVLVPELVGTSFDGCTVQNLLDMRAGIRFSEDYADLDADVRVYEQIAGHRPRSTEGLVESLYDYMPTLERHGPHGDAFVYQSILTDVLGWVLERATGRTFADLVSRHIWAKIGAEYDAEVTVDPGGCALADGGICATLRDLARFGLAHLPDSSVAERGAVSSQWVRACTGRDDELVRRFAQNATESSSRISMYHNNWWILDPQAPIFAGLGINGQFLYIDAVADTVIAKFSSWPKAADAELSELHFDLASTVATKVSDSATR